MESVFPGCEAVAEDAEWVVGAAEGVAAVVGGVVGVVVEGVEESGDAGSLVPPGSELGAGAPERRPGYPGPV